MGATLFYHDRNNYKPPMGTAVDWSLDINKGLSGAWLMHEGCLRPQNLARGVEGVPDSTMVIGDIVNGEYGYAINFDGTDDFISTGYAPVLTGSFTIMVKMRSTYDANNSAEFFGAIANTAPPESGDCGVIMSHWGTGGNNPDFLTIFVRDIDNQSTGFSDGTIVINDGNWHVCTLRLSKGDSIQGFIDGVLDHDLSDGTTGIIDFGSQGTDFNIGARNDRGTDSDHWPGDIEWVYFWERALTDDEIVFVGQHQFCMFYGGLGLTVTTAAGGLNIPNAMHYRKVLAS